MASNDTPAYQYAGTDEDGLATYRIAATGAGYDIPAAPKTRTNIVKRIATAARWALVLGAAAIIVGTGAHDAPHDAPRPTITVQMQRDANSSALQ